MTTLELQPASGPAAIAARRRLGAALIVFGAAGLVILVLLAYVILGPIGAIGAAAGAVDDQRARAVAVLPSAEAALDAAATAATNAGTSLQASGQSARDGSDLLVQLAASMDGMSAASTVDILGTRPFGALSDQLAAVAARSRSLASDLKAAATSLDANVGDSGIAATRFRDLGAQIGRLRTELEAGSTPAGSAGSGMSLATQITILRLLLLLLVLWLAGPAIAAIWLGSRWRRS